MKVAALAVDKTDKRTAAQIMVYQKLTKSAAPPLRVDQESAFILHLMDGAMHHAKRASIERCYRDNGRR